MPDELDEHEVVWDRYREGPYAGMTWARAKIVNDVLWGHLVRVWSHDDLKSDTFPYEGTAREQQVWRLMNPPRSRPERPEGQLGIFVGLRLPGSWGDGFQQAFDTRIATSFDNPLDPTRCNSGSQRVMGLGVVGEIEVLEPDPWFMCDVCMCWRPRRFLRERASIWDWDWIYHDAENQDDPSLVDYYHEYICREDCG